MMGFHLEHRSYAAGRHLARGSSLSTYSPLLAVLLLHLSLCYCTDSGVNQPLPPAETLINQLPQVSVLKAKRPFKEDGQHAPNAAAGFLLAEWTDGQLNMSDPLDRNLSAILDKDGPDLRPSRDFRDNISLELSKRALDLLHKRTKVAIGQQIDAAWPTIQMMLNESRVSNRCSEAVSIWMESAKRMDSWAVKMLNSWGHFPMSGLYDGTYSDVGSYDTCVNVKDNKRIGHAHYCSVAFKPVLPSSKDYELIVRKEPKELRDMFERQRRIGLSQTKEPDLSISKFFNPLGIASDERDAFTDLLEHAQYHHFVYYKWGTCWPIDCSPFDVRRLAKLAGRKSILLNGPVKCYSMHENDYEQPDDFVEWRPHQAKLNDSLGVANNGTKQQQVDGLKRPKKLVISIWDKNRGIFIWKPHFNTAHKVALTVILAVSALILFMTGIDLCVNRIPPLYSKFLLCLKGLPLDYYKNAHHRTDGPSVGLCSVLESQVTSSTKQHPSKSGFLMVSTEPEAAEVVDTTTTVAAVANLDLEEPPEPPRPPSVFMSFVDDFSILTNVPQFFRVSEGQLKNDILCLNGIRCITMMWIVMAHTMMYNDWSAFARTRTIEIAVSSMLTQPLFNGSYLVDTFFLMSGLLSAFTTFKHCKGLSAKFNSFTYIFGRWLRLTPQILFTSMMFILFPTLSSGPHWFPIVGEYSENCINNWWVTMLHLQAFYRKEEICNFVTWWISIDFFYHFFALAIIWIIMVAGHRYGFLSMAGIVGSAVAYQSWRHYHLRLPPNILSTIPQANAMWTTMILDFFWTPYAHSVPFFFGFYTGYLMAMKKKLIRRSLNTRRALLGWFLSVTLLVGQSYSTYWWVTGQAEYGRLASTIYFTTCNFIWTGCICWIIIACQHGYGGFINRILSWRVFIVCGKASYLVYLSHFQVLFLYFGNQHVVIEPSPVNMLYIVIGNIFLSTLLGIVLCSVYEIPWLKTHRRRLMNYV